MSSQIKPHILHFLSSELNVSPLLWGEDRARPPGNSVRLRKNQDHLPWFAGSGWSKTKLILPYHKARGSI